MKKLLLKRGNNGNNTIKNAANSNEYENIVVNQESMERRIEELYIEQFEKDITKKVEKQGFIVKKCKVEAKISQDEENTGITKIKLKVEKNNNNEEKSSEIGQTNEEKNDELESKIVTEIQKIKKVTTGVSIVEENNSNDTITKQDIQNLKMFLIKEYEVNEKCLEIN